MEKQRGLEPISQSCKRLDASLSWTLLSDEKKVQRSVGASPCAGNNRGLFRATLECSFNKPEEKRLHLSTEVHDMTDGESRNTSAATLHCESKVPPGMETI